MADKPDKVKPDYKKLREEAKDLIRYEKDRKNRIATITFNRPESLNSANIGMRQNYAEMIHKANVDDEVKVLIIRGEGKDFGGGGDLPEQRDMLENPGTPLLHELAIDDPDVRYPPGGSYRYLFTLTDHYARARAGNRPLQEFKKISIVEAKGYCYGWHFYQAGDADMVISSDDALFGHPSFRYAGWGPRMWTWIETMGLRKFQEMVFTGRPFSAKEMYDCGFVNAVVPFDDLEATTAKYADACARSRSNDILFAQKSFFEIYKQHQGEYMGSILSGMLESMGRQMRPDPDTFELNREMLDAGLTNSVRDNDEHFPPEWRLSHRGRAAE